MRKTVPKCSRKDPSEDHSPHIRRGFNWHLSPWPSLWGSSRYNTLPVDKGLKSGRRRDQKRPLPPPFSLSRGSKHVSMSASRARSNPPRIFPPVLKVGIIDIAPALNPAFALDYLAGTPDRTAARGRRCRGDRSAQPGGFSLGIEVSQLDVSPGDDLSPRYPLCKRGPWSRHLPPRGARVLRNGEAATPYDHRFVPVLADISAPVTTAFPSIALLNPAYILWGGQIAYASFNSAESHPQCRVCQ